MRAKFKKRTFSKFNSKPQKKVENEFKLIYKRVNPEVE